MCGKIQSEISSNESIFSDVTKWKTYGLSPGIDRNSRIVTLLNETEMGRTTSTEGGVQVGVLVTSTGEGRQALVSMVNCSGVKIALLVSDDTKVSSVQYCRRLISKLSTCGNIRYLCFWSSEFSETLAPCTNFLSLLLTPFDLIDSNFFCLLFFSMVIFFKASSEETEEDEPVMGSIFGGLKQWVVCGLTLHFHWNEYSTIKNFTIFAGRRHWQPSEIKVRR